MPQRNIVVLLTDQLRKDFLPAYGCRAIDTPHLDRLAARGVIFDRALTASPLCGPARASMMTGRYPSDHGVWTNDMPFREGMDYLAQRMNELGYATGAFGKMHHCPKDDAKGFDVMKLLDETPLRGRESYLCWLRCRRPEVRSIYNTDETRPRFKFTEEEYYEYWIASEAIAYINKQAQAGQSFLTWVSFQGPHAPYDPPSELDGCVRCDLLPRRKRISDERLAAMPPVLQYAIKTVNHAVDSAKHEAQREAYAQKIVMIDKQVGRVLDAVEANGLMDETTFVFLADHGDMLHDYELVSKGPYPFTASVGVPMMIANYPRLRAGARSDALVNTVDVPATLLDIAGADRGIGQSFSLLDLASNRPKHPRLVNFSELGDSFKLAEDERYRLCHYPFCDHVELYDLITDPDVTTNLAHRPEHAATLARLLMRLVDFGLVCKGVRVEASQFVPEQQHGLERYDPNYRDDFPVAYPLHQGQVDLIEAAGLDATFNRFCEDKQVIASYYNPYWVSRTP
ncbi:MAG: sulfatase [bacterium]